MSPSGSGSRWTSTTASRGGGSCRIRVTDRPFDTGEIMMEKVLTGLVVALLAANFLCRLFAFALS
jgi:hypothetical protein